MTTTDSRDTTAEYSGARTCEAQGCSFWTREGKPYCPEHVDLNPHAGEVIRAIARREEEDAEVERGDTPPSGYNIRGITSQAILQHLEEFGTRTRSRLCRELSLKRVVLDGYIEALVAKKLVVEGTTERGNATVTLHR